MSGKAPPRGPRALLSSLPTPASASQPSTSVPSTSTSPGSSSSKIGAHPPTAPRSLVNGAPSQPRTKPLINGYPPTSPGVIHAPLAPRSLQKGKQVESGWSTSDVSVSFCDLSGSTLNTQRRAAPEHPRVFATIDAQETGPSDGRGWHAAPRARQDCVCAERADVARRVATSPASADVGTSPTPTTTRATPVRRASTPAPASVTTTAPASLAPAPTELETPFASASPDR